MWTIDNSVIHCVDIRYTNDSYDIIITHQRLRTVRASRARNGVRSFSINTRVTLMLMLNQSKANVDQMSQ